MQPMQIVVEVLNAIDAHNLDKAERRLADSLVVRDITVPQSYGKADFVERMRALLAAFPDWKYDLDSIEADGKDVTVQVTAIATQTAPLKLGGRTITATGKRVNVPDQFIFTVVDDQVQSLVIDSPKGGGAAAMLTQLGAP